MRCKQCEFRSCSEPLSHPRVPAGCCLVWGGLHLSHGSGLALHKCDVNAEQEFELHLYQARALIQKPAAVVE